MWDVRIREGMCSLLKWRAGLEFQGGGAPWRAEGDSHHTLPHLLETRVTRDLSREAQKQVRKKTPLPFVFLGYRANMQTPQSKLPQREAPPPQAHTTADTIGHDGSAEAHAADGDQPGQHKHHSAAPPAGATFQSASALPNE